MSKVTVAAGVAAAGLVGAVIATELRKPEGERTWQGSLGGVIPYDLRPPTAERLRQRFWAPDDDTLFPPHGFGIGWSVNVGRVARRLGVV